MTPETFRAKAHSWFTGRPFVDAERGALGPQAGTLPPSQEEQARSAARAFRERGAPDGERCKATRAGGRWRCVLPKGHTELHVEEHLAFYWHRDEPVLQATGLSPVADAGLDPKLAVGSTICAKSAPLSKADRKVMLLGHAAAQEEWKPEIGRIEGVRFFLQPKRPKNRRERRVQKRTR